MENIYTKNNWNRDGYLKIKVGQYVADDVIEELRDSVPPATYKSTCFQPGEAYTHSVDYVELYMTFVIDNGMWKYIGLCPKGSIHPQPEMDYSTLNESRQGLKSMKLFNIIKQHGGFEEKTPSFYLHDMTDDDIIGVLPEDDLQKLMKMHVSDRNNYAIQHGFKINRGDTMEIIPLKDWTWIGVIERNHNLPNDEYGKTRIGKLKRERGNAKRRDGAHCYQWSDTGKWGSPRAEEFYMRRTQNDIANQRRQRYGDDAVHKLSEHVLSGLDEIPKTTNVRKFTDAVIKKLYRTSQPYTSHRFRDNDWRSLRSFVHTLEEVDGVKELNLNSTGPYKQTQEGAYKEYLVDIETTLGSKIGGFIRCHFCGSQENPWEVYDMTVNFYIDDENNNINENNMSKIYLNENDLKQMIKESVNRLLNEAIQNGEIDEAIGHRLGQGYQWLKNKWNNFTQDFKSGQDRQNYKNQNYDPYAFWGNEADDVRNFANGNTTPQAPPASQGGTAPQTPPANQGGTAPQTPPANQGGTAPQTPPASQGGTAPQTPPASQGGTAPQPKKMSSAKRQVKQNLEQIMKTIGMKPQYDSSTNQIVNWTIAQRVSGAKIQQVLINQWSQYN